jgi:uncharacterized protein (TIGR03663 family)
VTFTATKRTNGSAVPADAVTDSERETVVWLTVERGLYLAVLAIAAWLRFLELGARPLGPEEASQAWAAWRLSQGQVAVGSGLSALLLSLQYLTFLAAGAGDGLARLWPALVGTAMALLPYGLRGRLGRGGALAAALALAVSPTLVYFSRHSSGHIFVAASALALTVAALRWLDGDRRGLTFAGAAAAVMLVSSRSAWLMVLLLAGVGIWLVRRRSLPVAGIRDAVLAFGLVLGLGATAMLLHWRGLGLAADLLPDWLSSFLPRAGGYPAYWPALRLLLDEPLILIAGVGGIVIAALRRDRLGVCLAVWAAIALVATTVAGGRHPGDLLLVVVPLALLAGQAVARLLAFVTEGHLPGARHGVNNPSWYGLEALWLLGVVLVLLVTSAIWLATITRAQPAESVWIALSPLGLLVLIVVLYGFWGGWDVSARALGAAALLVLALFSLSLAWGLSLDEQAARQGAVQRGQGTYGMRRLPATLEILSAERVGDPHEMAVDIVTLGQQDQLTPMLGWALRDFAALRWTEERLPKEARAVVVAPEALELPLGDTYAGQDFPLVATWSPEDLRGRPLWRWLLYREGTAAPPSENVILWVRTGG